MQQVNLTQEEASSIQNLIGEITSNYQSVEDPGFLANATVYAHELPRRLRRSLHEFKLREPDSAILLISGFPINDDKLGNTPHHWDIEPKPESALEEEILLVLFGSILGESIAWSTQQSGRVVHDILPIRGKEHEQLGSGSEELLWWHCEDAFNPFRGDYLGMLCLRNPTDVATTFASIEGIELDDETWDRLFEPHYTIRPDESHLLKNRSADTEWEERLEDAYQKMEELNQKQPKIAVLSGDRRSPYLQIDPYFMDPVEDQAAQKALNELVRAIDGKLVDVVLKPGDLLFIDNYKAVHGRKPFRAMYNGKDRWLKRINIARDLRKSRTHRPSAESRVIY